MVKTFPRVLQVLPALESGGVEKATCDWVRILRRDNPDIPTFVTSAGGRLVSQIVEEGAVHVLLPLATKNPFRLLQNARKLVLLAQQQEIQLIHARSRAPAWSALWASRFLNLPFITTYHAVYKSAHRLKQFYNSVMARGNRVIAISRFVAEHIRQHHGFLNPNICLISEGIDTDKFNPSFISSAAVQKLRRGWGVPEGSRLILLPGRLTRWKGQEVLAQALQLLNSKDIFTVFLGDDQGRHDYRHQLIQKTWGLPVAFVKDCSEMPTAYAAADLVLSCSVEAEAFGRVTAEALAMARPFIGTQLGATPEMCLQGETGFLVPPGDAYALAQKIQEVFCLPLEKKTDLAHAARDHIVSHFSLDRMTTLTKRVYEEVMECPIKP